VGGVRPAGERALTERKARDGFDVAVIGAGVVGCAIARRLTLEGARVVVLEKAADVLDGASKANSAILHTGFDAPPGSLEAALVAAGHEEYRAIHARLGLPLMETGALVIAWSEAEEARLPAIVEDARRNGVDDVALLTARQVRALEPGLGEGVRAAVRVPGESIVDAWSAPHAYLLQALGNGAVLALSAEVLSGHLEAGRWRLETAGGPVEAGVVVNAAGLHGDTVDRRLLGETHFSIRPRKGQFVVFDKSAFALADHILLPVPTAITKGVVVCRTAWGNLLVGPTAEEQEDREAAPLTREALEALLARARAILPALAGHEVTAAYAGLRPASETKDYRIRHDAARRMVTVGGIRSTGLSAALGIARHVHRLVEEIAGPTQRLADPDWPRVRNISEAAPRDWQAPGNGGIVCHCERVTRREVEEALKGPLAARSLAGLKRRTRVTMGRCQGFYCTAELARITRGRLAEPMMARDGDH